MQEPATDRAAEFRWSDTLLVIVAGLIGAVFIGGALIALIYGLEDETIDPAAQFWVLLPAQVLAQIAAVVWISRRKGTGSLLRDFGFVIEPRDLRWLLAGPLALAALGAVATAMRAVLQLPDQNPQALLDTVADYRGSVTALAIVIGVTVLGPISEELTFRGLLLRTGLDKGLSPWVVTVISAGTFSLVHLVDWSLASLAGSVTLVVLFLFGILLAQVRIRTGNLAASIFMHSGFNLTTIIALFFFPEI